jgi:hypothetical protein
MGKGLQKKKDWVEITTHYLDHNNDYIQIYLKNDDEVYLLTDGGSTITGLIQEGCSLDNPKHQKLLQLTLNGYGITENNGTLQVRATPDDFALRKHSLLQSILAFNRIGL